MKALPISQFLMYWKKYDGKFLTSFWIVRMQKRDGRMPMRRWLILRSISSRDRILKRHVRILGTKQHLLFIEYISIRYGLNLKVDDEVVLKALTCTFSEINRRLLAVNVFIVQHFDVCIVIIWHYVSRFCIMASALSHNRALTKTPMLRNVLWIMPKMV